MHFSRLQNSVYRAAQILMAVAVVLMAGWNAYICLRLRPDVPTVVINLSFWLLPILMLLAASGRLWRSLALGTAVTFFLQRLHWLKWRYLEQTWTAADLRLALDSANWLVVRQYPEILAFVVAGASLLVLSWLLVPRESRVRWQTRGLAVLMAVALAGTVVQWRHRHVFDPFGFNTYGHFANLVYSASTLTYQPPAIDGSSALFLARAATLPDGHDPTVVSATAAPATPDIVIWLQESAMDLRLFDLPGADLPALPMYEPDASTRAHGPLRVHSWGGSTWLTEFALLTGLSHEDFGASGNGVYYTVTSKLRYSLPTLLKSHGYRAVAISGVPKALYNMEAAQRDLGFDEVLNPLDFPEWGGKSVVQNLVSDAELGRFAQQILARSRDRPVLLFVLSMMQHGPYDSTHPVRYGLDQAELPRPLAARTSDYVDRMVATSIASAAFGAELLGGSRPVVYAYFGDHQPNLGGPVPYVSGVAHPQYLTAYAVKTNFPTPVAVGHARALDISYLAAVILEQAGLPLGPLFDANRRMRLLCDGQLTECLDQALTRSYRAHLYRDLLAARLH